MFAPLRMAFCAVVAACVALSFAECGSALDGSADPHASNASAAKNSPADAKSEPAGSKTIELFDGIKSGDLQVRVIPKNEFLSQVRFKNTTRQPLTVTLPKAVAAVQVFKQVFGPGQFPGNNPNNPLNGGNGNNAGNNRGAQNVGGQFGFNGNGNGNPFQGIGFGQAPGGANGIGNGFFSVPAEKTVVIPLHTVCLEHGKPTPNVRMTYELRPLRSTVDDPALERLLAEFHPKKSDRRAVQAAAWHLASSMSWKDLRAKSIRHIGGRRVRYFTLGELRTAYRIVEHVKKESQPAESRPGRRIRKNSEVRATGGRILTNSATRHSVTRR